MGQLRLDLDSLSERARAARDAMVAALDGGPQLADLDPEIFDELDAAGVLDEIARMEDAERVDWADPDAHDLDTPRWYDEAADPYNRGPEPVEACEFYLGTHRPHWLHTGRRDERPAGPLFVSARQLRERRRSAYPACDTPYAIDSGGFTELRQHGGWVTTPEQYAAEVVALARETGTLRWAAIQDWMVEDDALARTGLTIEEHQRRTVASFLRLRELAPEIRWLPVLQGQTLADYEAHLAMYREAGVCLAAMGRVGVGSVCRRQGSAEIADILRTLASHGLKLHGFGVKTGGLEAAAAFLASADSLAWSLGARKRFPGAQNSQAVAEDYRRRMVAIGGVV